MGLDIGSCESETRRASVDDCTNTGTVGLAVGSHSEKVAKGRHGGEVSGFEQVKSQKDRC